MALSRITTASIEDGTVVAGISNGNSNVTIASANSDVSIFTAGTEAMLIDSGQRTKFPTTIGVGGATPSTSGSGISFPATASASSDANTLDDYEEGDWTPSVGGDATYTTRYGKYTKIGNVVTCQFRLKIATLGTGTQGGFSGFPFTSLSLGAQSGHCSYYQDLGANVIYLSFYVSTNSTSGTFVSQSASGPTTTNGPTVWANGADIYGHVIYRVG
jgi:hypothetical protein